VRIKIASLLAMTVFILDSVNGRGNLFNKNQFAKKDCFVVPPRNDDFFTDSVYSSFSKNKVSKCFKGVSILLLAQYKLSSTRKIKGEITNFIKLLLFFTAFLM